MGISIFNKSYSSFDGSENNNPDPNNYKITNAFEKNGYLLLWINYPDAKNFEGEKLLLFKNTSLKDLESQKSIDPHFSDNKKFHSPIARFEPTQEGLDLAFYIIEKGGK